jgi:Protein of unknown function (DUF982)
MANLNFDPPVAICLGGSGQTRAVASVREASKCLMSDRWPETESIVFESALLTMIATIEGRESADNARFAFIRAARKAGILVERSLMH